MKDMIGFFGMCAFLVLLVAIPSAIFVGAPMTIYDYWRCGVLSEQTGRETHFVLFGGCYIEYAGNFIPRDKFVGAQVTGD